jgi:hypothetical protein
MPEKIGDKMEAKVNEQQQQGHIVKWPIRPNSGYGK